MFGQPGLAGERGRLFGPQPAVGTCGSNPGLWKPAPSGLSAGEGRSRDGEVLATGRVSATTVNDLKRSRPWLTTIGTTSQRFTFIAWGCRTVATPGARAIPVRALSELASPSFPGLALNHTVPGGPLRRPGRNEPGSAWRWETEPDGSRQPLATIDQFPRDRSSHSGLGKRSGLFGWTRVALMPRPFFGCRVPNDAIDRCRPRLACEQLFSRSGIPAQYA